MLLKELTSIHEFWRASRELSVIGFVKTSHSIYSLDLIVRSQEAGRNQKPEVEEKGIKVWIESKAQYKDQTIYKLTRRLSPGIM